MGLLDKAKEAKDKATHVAQKAQEAGRAKVDEVQAKRRTDTLLRDLGAAVFAERTGRGTAVTAGEIERLLAELRDHEAAGNRIDPVPGSAMAPEPGGTAEPSGVAQGSGGPAPTVEPEAEL